MKKVIIWGAGRIGRGFAAEIFRDGGYELNFVDNDKNLINQLNQSKKYLVYKIAGENQQEKVEISGYHAYTPEDKKTLTELFYQTELMALAVFPGAFEQVAKSLAELISAKAKRNADSKLDIIIFANMLHAGQQIRTFLKNAVDEETQAYFEKNVGISESIVVRMAVDPTPEMKAEDPLVIATNGYKKLYIDGTSFAGEKPECPDINYVDNFGSWEMRKLYTYNMLHALFAYTGVYKGCQFVYNCTKDADIMTFARGAIEEVGMALQKAFGFTPEEMGTWIKECFNNMGNPYLNDRLTRVGGDPKRKLKYGDRLSGAALLCKTWGVMPYWLTKAMAYAFLYDVKEDVTAGEIQQDVRLLGIRNAVRKYCGFDQEYELVQLIVDRYKEAVNDPAGNIHEDLRRVQSYKNAWAEGFKQELLYKGCGQCTLLAVRNLYNIFEGKVFEAATPFSGGMSLCGDGTCGGYAGGLMSIGLIAARTLDDLETKNKTGQYKAYGMSAEFHDLFKECYGSVICSDVHRCIFGRAYILREKKVRVDFEAAGAHQDKCTSVIAMTLYMLTKVFEQNGVKIGI